MRAIALGQRGETAAVEIDPVVMNQVWILLWVAA